MSIDLDKDSIAIEYTSVKNNQGHEVSAAVLTPDLEGELALVYASTIKRLAEYLPSVPLSSIKRGLQAEIANAETLEDMMNVIEDELKFHKSVRMINAYQHEESNEEDVLEAQAHTA